LGGYDFYAVPLDLFNTVAFDINAGLTKMSNEVFQCTKNNLIHASVILADIKLSISVTRLE